MNSFQISYKNIVRNKLTTFLNVVLVGFGIGILSILFLASAQINNELETNAKDIDAVVGAKGSPLQLVLSTVYHIDFPTGNIPLAEANTVKENPMIKRVVPLALGDSYEGYRIVGTDTSFTALYGLQLEAGKFWEKDLEATIGYDVAQESGLKVGSRFYGAHGLTGGDDIHKDHAYVVKGILKKQHNVTDKLVLTNVGSIYKMHEEHGEGEHHEQQQEGGNQEITALLVQYHSPMSVVIFPRMINESTNMQAASPAMESARLFSLIGVGIDTLKWFAVLIMVISAMSIFVSLLNSMKEKKYDLAIMRCLGGSKVKLFRLVMLEGLLITFAGAVLGLVLGHLVLEAINYFKGSSQTSITGFYFVYEELYLLVAGLIIGVIASVIPASQVYRVDIAKTLGSGKS